MLQYSQSNTINLEDDDDTSQNQIATINNNTNSSTESLDFGIHEFSLTMFKQNPFAYQPDFPNPLSAYPVYDMKIYQQQNNNSTRVRLLHDLS